MDFFHLSMLGMTVLGIVFLCLSGKTDWMAWSAGFFACVGLLIFGFLLYMELYRIPVPEFSLP